MRAECVTELEHALLANILMDVEYDYAFMRLPVFYSDTFAILGWCQLFREEALVCRNPIKATYPHEYTECSCHIRLQALSFELNCLEFPVFHV